jgi:hypothetical protein
MRVVEEGARGKKFMQTEVKTKEIYKHEENSVKL